MEQIKEETLDFIYEHTKSATEAQLITGDAIDSKAFQIFGIASIVMGFASFISVENEQIRGFVIGMLILASAFYLAEVVLLFCGVFPIKMRRSLFADQLWSQHWSSDVKQIKHSLVVGIRDAYEYNSHKLNDKAVILQWLIVLVTLQILAVISAVSLSFQA